MQKCSSSSVVLCAIFLLCGMDGVWVTFGVVYGIKAQELHIRKKNPGENYTTVGRCCLGCRLTNFDVIVVHLRGAHCFSKSETRSFCYC